MTLPNRPTFVFDPQDMGPEPTCEGVTDVIERRICKVQRRTWRTLDRQIKWQQRQEERQSKIERMINDIFYLLQERPAPARKQQTGVQKERVQAPFSRTNSVRTIRNRPSYKGYIRPARACRTVPPHEREACLKGLE